MSSDQDTNTAEQGQDFLDNPFGLLTTTGDIEVVKAADVEKDSAQKEEVR